MKIIAYLSCFLGVVFAQKPAAFIEQGGRLEVEAEQFHSVRLNQVRDWYLTSAAVTPNAGKDADPSHVAGASGGAYLEILPDTRHNHGHKLIHGENFAPLPGKMAILSYKVRIQTPGRYYVWVRAYSTGSEDNGIHVGLDGTWPESGARMQWCNGKNSWRWESKQRTVQQHCGEPYKIFLDIKEAGEHTIEFSMREDGFEFDAWMITTDRTANPNPPPAPVAKLVEPRAADGDGSTTLSGELQRWHKLTLDLAGPFAHERDTDPNPFVDRSYQVSFTHESGNSWLVPGYFAADGKAGESSAEAGTVWRAHFTPPLSGAWQYKALFANGSGCAFSTDEITKGAAPWHGQSGRFSVAESDKSGRDFRAKGRLAYVGKHYLQHQGSGEYFLKAGADAPETFLGYADFDDTVARKAGVPLKTWGPHLQDWQAGDPTWKDGKGKGMIGALNYLSGKGANVFSFLTYNAGGDGDNVWPFVERNQKMHYDCSKLDQWGYVLDHATTRGLFLHFKLQETEIDDNRGGKKSGGRTVPTSLDGGALGPERKLYLREIVARFGHNLGCNWNLGEENTQTTAEQMAMATYLQALDPYNQLIVVHTYPGDQDKVYNPLLGGKSPLRGASLQNSSIGDTHWQTVKWVTRSAKAGVPWVVAFDESGSAAHAACPDLGYKGYDGRDKDGKMTYTHHDVRKQTLWGTLMGGGCGVEYYFGYKYAENDLVCEDWRSRDQTWDFSRIALTFFAEHKIPVQDMQPMRSLVGTSETDNDCYCFAKPGELYLVYLAEGGTRELDLQGQTGRFTVQWFNPRVGGALQAGTVESVNGGAEVSIGLPPSEAKSDWLAIIRR